MLLSGGDPPAQEWFMVQTKSKPRVQRQRLQVQRIFRVKLNAFQSRPDTPYFWLQLEGPRENTGKAKCPSGKALEAHGLGLVEEEYLKGLCSPELWKEVRYPAALHCAFLGAQGLFLDCLCWSTLAYLVPGPPGSLMVGGLTESFIMTQNWLEELVGRLRWGPAPLLTPRGIWEAEVTRAFGALVWIRGDQYSGDLLQLPPAVQELLLSLVRDAAGKEDIIQWLGRIGSSNSRSDPELLICPTQQQKEGPAMVSMGDGPGPFLEMGSPDNSKRLTSLGATGALISGIPGQNTQPETANQLVRVSSNNQGGTDSAREEGPVQASSGQDPADHTQALSQQRQVRRGEDKLPFQPPVSTLGVCSPWKAWTPGPAFGPLWPGAIAATFWRINELQSLHLAWLLSQACFSFPFWQRPLGPIQFKLPGQNPLPLNLEWKQKELVPLPSANSTVTSFQRYHEALNTPFELNLSGEPGNQGLRRVVIDGSSVAMVHGLQHFFSCRGIAMAVQYFWNRGHREVTVFVPTWQLKKNRRVRESHFLTKLHSLKMLSITPSQLENGKKITTYDYRFMVKLAEETDGIIVTNEQLHVLMNNSKKLMVKDRLLPFTFAGNLFMVPDDPLGRDGPTLDEFLKKPNRLDTDIGNFLKVWKTLPPRSAGISEQSDDADPGPPESLQNVEEVREEKEERQGGEQTEGQEMQKPAEEEDDLDSSLVSVFRAECPSLSEEILRCLSLHDPPDGALDIDLLPAVASPHLGIPWDGKAPCQQVLAHLARLTTPSNFTALSFFVGFMDSHRDVIPDYEALMGPLHSLLKQKPDWQWDREHEKAFLALKRALVSALCLTAPNPQLPFRLEVTVSQVALTAAVYQEVSGRKHPIAYTSKPLLPDEESEGPQSGGDSPYAVAWALKHFSRCIGDTPVVLDLSYASRTTVDPEAWDGRRVAKAWLIRWSLLVQDKGKRALELTLLQGLLGENRLLTPAASMPRFFQVLPPFSDLSTFVCIHMSGYCFYREDEWCAGFGLYVLSPTSPPVSLSFSCSPYTPTYAHLAAVACGLERFGQSHLPVVFLTHCNWIFSLLWELLPLWKARGFLSSDGAPLPHPSLLSYIIALTSGLSSLPFIYRTSYRGSLFAVTVDTLAKQGAQGSGQWWNLPKDVPVPVVPPRTTGKRPNLLALQLSDSTLADIITKLQAGQKLSSSSPFSSAFNSLSIDKESGLLMFKGDKKPRVWVVPRQLRRDLIFAVHDLPMGAHQRPEETYKKLRLLGWWPGMQEHVRDYCRSCLFCIPRNLTGGESKVIESLWPLRSTAPWSNLQIEVVGPVTISEEGHKHVLIVADPNTRWVEAFPLKPYTHTAVAQVLLQHVFARWGVPIRLEAAQGPQFARHVLVSCGLALGAHVASLSRDLQFPCLTSSAAYWEFKRALKEFIFLHGRKWAASLPLLHLAFRASSSQASPFQILTGAEERLTEPLWWEMSSANVEGLKMDVFLLQLRGELLDLHWRAAEKASEKAENRRFKRESQEKEWNVGDQVLLLSLPRNGSSAKWVGPFYIGDRLSLSLYRVWGFPTPEKLGCIYPSSLMKTFAKSGTPLSFKVLEQ
ncbi:Protein NYNRIN [Camelus dromedarius]|uniref:Protein NYNRIN n=1 Tax=Camelus dromedarius TaxID=9838 RepID=A0A5N4E123_CAMDR|nr:Protein NYNRIN [Camelus dromedarius]